MAKILIHGYYGAMGQTLAQMIDDPVYGFDKISHDPNVFTNYEDIPEVDVIIDFSHFSVVPNLLAFVQEKKIPTVLCTTGIETLDAQIKTLSEIVPIFKSRNMSIGINLLIQLAKIGAKSLDFDIEIIEKHHNKKVDAPSGTALMIYDGITEVKNYSAHLGRKGMEKRQENEIGIHAIRGGTITGEHTVLFAGEDENIEISHQATSKKVFAKGAIKAAYYLKDQKPGLYNMNDLLGGNNV